MHGRALGGSKQKKSNGRTRITRKDWSKVKHKSAWGGEECKIVVWSVLDVHWGRGSKHKKSTGRTRTDWNGAKQSSVRYGM